MGLKKRVMDISYSLGLEGDITPDVIHVAERVLDAHRTANPKLKAIETMRIARLMRELRNEVLFGQGKLCKRVCAWCSETLGYREGSGITHGICEKCAKEVKASCL